MLDSRGFDLWADGYDKSVGLSDESNTYPFAGYKQVLNSIYGKVLSLSSPVVLDIGFGTGTLTKRLYEHGCQIYGLDFSRHMIELAQEKMPDAVLVQGDFSIGLPDRLMQQTYDFIIATYSLHHLEDEQKITFLHTLLRLLNKGGKILVGDVAFPDRSSLEQCRSQSGENWDDDEIYFVTGEIVPRLDCKVDFEKMSFCAGLYTLERK